MSTLPTIHVLYENPAWLPPLLEGLAAEGFTDVRTIELVEGLVEGATPNTQYTVDVNFRHESVTSGRCAADVSVNGQRVPLAMPLVVRPLSSIHLYNLDSGTSLIGKIDIWYERARPDQSWNVINID